MFNHILIPTDGSPVSKDAAKAGVELAIALGSRVTAYHALEDQQPVYIEGYLGDQLLVGEMEKRAHEVAQDRVDEIGEIAKAAGVPFDTLITNAGTSYQGIIDAAEKQHCDVIFMGSHGRHGLPRLLMGSVTEKVLTHSKIPVVVYR